MSPAKTYKCQNSDPDSRLSPSVKIVNVLRKSITQPVGSYVLLCLTDDWLSSVRIRKNLSKFENFFIGVVIEHMFTPGSVLTTEYRGTHFRCRKL
jgi:hypothetical protein